MNGFVFILIGLQLPESLRAVPGKSMGQFISDAAVISLAVIGIRLVWVFPATYLRRLLFRSLRARDPYPQWRHVAIVASRLNIPKAGGAIVRMSARLPPNDKLSHDEECARDARPGTAI